MSTNAVKLNMASAIEVWPISRLKPYARNARTHDDEQVDKIAASILEFGFNNPVLVDEKDGIIAGHGRLMAAQKIGLKEVPVIPLTHMTEAQRRAYILADNRLALDAGWDDEMLAGELSALKDMEFDLALTGFNDDELADLLEDEDSTEGQTEDDAIPEVPYFPTSVPGDVWILGKHRVMCGDATSIDAVEKLMAGAKASLVVTDPPYNVAYEGKTADAMTIQNDSMDGADFYEFLRSAYLNMFAVADDGAGIYVFHADLEGVNFRRALVDSGFKLSQVCIWVKQTMVLGRNDYHWQHEPVLYGWKPTSAHNWHSDRSQTTVWKFDRPTRSTDHPTMKPIDLIQYPIENSSKKGQIVLDLFGGSGSTLIACEKTSRQARLMELDPKYVDVIVKRWQDFTGKQAKLEGDDRTFDEMAADRKPIDG